MTHYSEHAHTLDTKGNLKMSDTLFDLDALPTKAQGTPLRYYLYYWRDGSQWVYRTRKRKHEADAGFTFELATGNGKPKLYTSRGHAQRRADELNAMRIEEAVKGGVFVEVGIYVPAP